MWSCIRKRLPLATAAYQKKIVYQNLDTYLSEKDHKYEIQDIKEKKKKNKTKMLKLIRKIAVSYIFSLRAI